MSFYDVTENFLKNKSNGGGLDIVFVNVPTGKTVSLKAFITSWEDSFKQDWKPYDSFGRMDSIRIYQKTSRQLVFNIDIPSASPDEASFNFNCIQNLIQMSYPVFEEITVTNNNNSSDVKTATESTKDNAEGVPLQEQANSKTRVVGSVMSSPPFFNISFSNWANSKNSLPYSGLYGTIDNIKYSPDFSAEAGGFYGNDPLGMTSFSKINNLVPKLMRLSINMTVLHVEKLGFREDKEFGENLIRTKQFPYNAEEINDNTQVMQKYVNEQSKESAANVARHNRNMTNKEGVTNYLTKVVGDRFQDFANFIQKNDFKPDENDLDFE